MKRDRFVLLALAIVLVFAPVSGFAQAKPGVTYTALGDSIGAGYGGTGGIGYTDLLRNHLARTRGTVTYHDLCENGLTSAELRVRLTDSASPYFGSYNAAVASADIITISIGGNDLLAPLVLFASANPQVLTPGYLESLTPAEIQSLVAPLVQQLDQNVAAFGANLAVTAGYIRAMNPDAEIHVNTLYTPIRPRHVLFGLVDAYVRAINAGIAYCAVDPSTGLPVYEVVDVYSKFADYGNPRKLLVFDLANLNFALHPTDRGYKFIYNLQKDALSEQ